MSTEKLVSQISDLLPDKETGINAELGDNRNTMVEENAEDIVRRKTARELAELKYREKDRLKRMQEREQVRMEAGIAPGRTAHQQKEIEEQEAIVATIENLEEQNNSRVPELIRANVPTISPEHASVLQTTTRKDIVKLLTSLNINLNLQLTKNDTANLLACLLTCNETQLDALYKNKKVPVAIKTVIKRLLEDVKHGQMGTIEALWDRIFGKAGMILDLPQQQAQATGIIPGTPISREAYVVLRETIIK